MMSIAAKVREKLISSFRAELAEHIQTMTDGLLALEQGRVAGEQRQSVLENIFRAAHSLKGAARAVGVTMIEQLAHALEDLLDAMRNRAVKLTPELFTACYQALDAIQAVQTAYESGETTPPVQALQALADLEPFRSATMPLASEELLEAPHTGAPEVALADAPQPPTPTFPPSSGGDETIRVSVSKLDTLMAQLSELLVTKIRAEQRLAQVHELQEFMTLWQKEWLSVRTAYSRLLRQDISGVLGLRRPEPVESLKGNASGLWRPELIGGRRPEFAEGPILSKVEGSRGGNGHGKLGKDVLHLLNYVGNSQERLREMNALMNNFSRQHANDTMQMSLVIDELEHEIKRIRMLPLSTITGPFGRMVRDLAQEAGKEAVLQIVGGDTELDKRVLEQIKDPLIHMLRNAIDHGIEPPEQRVALGKPRSGTITLTAEQLGKDVVICVSDDGAGLDLDAIRQAIMRHGLDAQALSETELVEIIFKVGISTSPIITDISGRGVGLDVVRRNVEALHGRIDVDWTPGEGAAFTLTLPLRLTSSHGLLLRASNQLFAIPLNAIERILYISPQEIAPLEGQDTIRYNGRPLTLVRLNDVLELPHTDRQRDSVGLSKGEARILVVILAAAERRMAFAVDELAGEQEIVIKGLGKQLTRVGGIAGAAVMGSGEVVLILNVADLIKLAMRGKRRSVLDARPETAPSGETRAQRRILIVDDSITTRTLEKNILEAAGYTVQLAIDGHEALSAIATGGMPDLIVSDIVMPRIDGFELTRRIKDDPNTVNVPVILVTSLSSSEDKARGIEAGADAYIVKSSFDQNNLLETIEQLV
jgi:two-component system chemotaxis sensor kinase CheA